MAPPVTSPRPMAHLGRPVEHRAVQRRVALVVAQLRICGACQQRRADAAAVALGGQVQRAAAVVTQLGLSNRGSEGPVK